MTNLPPFRPFRASPSTSTDEPTLDERRAATAEFILLSAMVARGEAVDVAEARQLRNARRSK
jgi:hypothetical protein